MPERYWYTQEDRVKALNELKKEQSYIKELSLKTCKGKKRVVTFIATSVKDIHNELKGTQGILIDISDKEVKSL